MPKRTPDMALQLMRRFIAGAKGKTDLNPDDVADVGRALETVLREGITITAALGIPDPVRVKMILAARREQIRQMAGDVPSGKVREFADLLDKKFQRHPDERPIGPVPGFETIRKVLRG